MPNHRERQEFIRYYKNETGELEVDMRKVAEMALKMGWKVPKPVSAIDALAKQFSESAREEIRYDKVTSQPYRVNHVFSDTHGDKQLNFWVDIDEAPRKPMVKSLIKRRESMVYDGYQLTLDADHWNSIHKDEEPIVVEMDLTMDIDIKKAATEAKSDAA